MKELKLDRNNPVLYVSKYIKYFCEKTLKNNGVLIPNKLSLQTYKKAKNYLQIFK